MDYRKLTTATIANMVRNIVVALQSQGIRQARESQLINAAKSELSQNGYSGDDRIDEYIIAAIYCCPEVSINARIPAADPVVDLNKRGKGEVK